MSCYFDLNYRYNKLLNLIKYQNTGTPLEFATQLHISERQLYRMIKDLRDKGLDINYSKKSHTYYLK